MVTFSVLAEDEVELDELVLDLLFEHPARPETTMAAPATPIKIPRFTTAPLSVVTPQHRWTAPTRRRERPCEYRPRRRNCLSLSQNSGIQTPKYQKPQPPKTGLKHGTAASRHLANIHD